MSFGRPANGPGLLTKEEAERRMFRAREALYY
jgi:hypothetical protein